MLLVTCTHSGGYAKDFLIQCQKSIGIKVILLLRSHVPVRWNTLYLMLERIKELQNALALFCQDKRYSTHMITGHEWTLIGKKYALN